MAPKCSVWSVAEVGAHIRKHNAADKNISVVPMCKAHDAETEKSLDFGDTLPLPANASGTFGKR